MRVCVIDMDHYLDHSGRQDEIVALLRDHKVKVLPSESGIGIDPTGVDLLLLHAGEAQDDCGITVQSLIERFSSSLILCYSGGTPVDAALEPRRNVALFRSDVPRGPLGEMFSRTLRKVIEQWPVRQELQENWFRSSVTGFDPVLEAKLEVLCARLERRQPSVECRETLLRSYPNLFDDDGQLIVESDLFDEDGQLIVESHLEGVANLRKTLFNEEPWRAKL